MSNINGLPTTVSLSMSSTSTTTTRTSTLVPTSTSISLSLQQQIQSSDPNSSGLQQLISSFHPNSQPHLLLNSVSNLNYHHPHPFLLDDLENEDDDFDVSLSSLCLGSGGVPSNETDHPSIMGKTAIIGSNNSTFISSTTLTSTSTTTSFTLSSTTASYQQPQTQLHFHHHQDHNNNINLQNIPLINQFFSIGGVGTGAVGSILSDMIKIEDEYFPHHHQQSHHSNLMDSSDLHPTLSSSNNNMQQHVQQHQTSTSTNASATVVTNSSPTNSSTAHQQNKPHHSVMVRSQQQQQAQSIPSSPAMLLNHLNLSSIRSSPSSSSNSSSTTAAISSSPSTTTSSTTTEATAYHNLPLHHAADANSVAASAVNTITHHLRGSGGFDPNEIYYGDNNRTQNDDSSCQSLSSVPDSSTIVHNTKSLVLQSTTVLMPAATGGGTGPVGTTTTAEEKLVSKRIRFKGLIQQDHHQLKHLEQQEHQELSDQQQTLDAPNPSITVDQQLDLDTASATMLEQNPFAYRTNTETSLNENIYSSRNVSNCYSYAWRRWSKTDAPSVKNHAAGTVQVPHTMPHIDEDGRKFQYILGAPTSAGTRVGSMTMTYLNQGQSYEIRLKKLKKVPMEPNLKTSVRLGFVEKRLQYRENEELSSWVVAHNNGRMIDIDFSMSYGVFDVDLRSTYNHSITFVWNPGREASIFVKINCISTEFTSKRHGGERGTPFRLIVDTYLVDGTKVDSACCLIKVFKSKGAERKHKTDRDRVAKHPDSENYYQPSYDCTLLTTFKEDEVDHSLQQQQDQQNPDIDQHESTSTLTNRSLTESPTGSEMSIPNTPISPQTPYMIHHHQQILLDPSHHSASSPQFSTMSTNGSNLHQTPPPISSCSPLATSKHQEHYVPRPQQQQQLMSKSSSSESMNPLAPVGPVTNYLESSSAATTPTISSPIPSSIMMAASQIPQSTSSNNNEYEIGRSTSNSSLSIRSISLTSKNSSTTTTLPVNAGAIETYEWLKRNRFFRLAEQLCDYTAEDLRRLSRDDLIQLCDFKDGIRLYNLIHMPEISVTKLTIFITLDGNEHYALYFKHLTVEEFREKLAECFNGNNIIDQQLEQQKQHSDVIIGGSGRRSIRLRYVHMTGPNGIRVRLTNNVIQNMKNESIYRCSVTKVDDEYDIVIGLINNQ